MWKIFCRVIACILLLQFIASINCVAVETSDYILADIEMSISLPGTYTVCTRDILRDNPNFSCFGLSGGDLLSYYRNGNIYLDGENEDATKRIMITMVPDDTAYYSDCSDVLLNAIGEGLSKELSAYAYTNIKWSIYRHEQTPFILLECDMTVANLTTHSLLYYTGYNGKAIIITIASCGVEMTSAHREEAEAIVNSAYFYSSIETDENIISEEPLIYTDKETNITFSLPSGWYEEPLSKERAYLDARFKKQDDANVMILYGCTDFWNSLTAAEKNGYERSDWDNLLVSEEKLSDIFGVDARTIQKKQFGGKEYYFFEQTVSENAYGLDFTFTMSNAIRIENGYLYLFEINQGQQEKGFAEFEKMLEGVQYVEHSNVEEPTSPMPSTICESVTATTYAATMPQSAQAKTSSEKTDARIGWFLWWIIASALYLTPPFFHFLFHKKRSIKKRTARNAIVAYTIVAIIITILIELSAKQSLCLTIPIFFCSFICKFFVKESNPTKTNSTVPDSLK